MEKYLKVIRDHTALVLVAVLVVVGLAAWKFGPTYNEEGSFLVHLLFALPLVLQLVCVRRLSPVLHGFFTLVMYIGCLCSCVALILYSLGILQQHVPPWGHWIFVALSAGLVGTALVATWLLAQPDESSDVAKELRNRPYVTITFFFSVFLWVTYLLSFAFAVHDWSEKLAACRDKVQDGAETAVDCGGGRCLPCDTGKRCKVATDCASGKCEDVTEEDHGTCRAIASSEPQARRVVHRDPRPALLAARVDWRKNATSAPSIPTPPTASATPPSPTQVPSTTLPLASSASQASSAPSSIPKDVAARNPTATIYFKEGSAKVEAELDGNIDRVLGQYSGDDARWRATNNGKSFETAFGQITQISVNAGVRIELVGSADDKPANANGPYPSNYALATQRAQNVQEFIEAKLRKDQYPGWVELVFVARPVERAHDGDGARKVDIHVEQIPAYSTPFKTRKSLNELHAELTEIRRELTSEIERSAVRHEENLANAKSSKTKDVEVFPLLDYVYFTVYTITTTGYGDIMPQTADAKFICSLANFYELFFLVIFFNVLVSRSASNGNGKKESKQETDKAATAGASPNVSPPSPSSPPPPPSSSKPAPKVRIGST